MNKMVLVIIFIAFLFRLIAINQSLWLDEATTAQVVHNYSYVHIIAKFSPFDFHPPFFYLFMKAWTDIFGYSEIALRMPSVLFSILAGWMVYKTATLLYHKDAINRVSSVGIWSALFFLFNPLIIYYSQEARMYMMVTFLLSVSLYYFMAIITSKSSSVGLRAIILFNIFTAISFLTFYGSIFLITTYFIVLLWKRQISLIIKLLPGVLTALLIVSPLLYQQFLHSREALHIVANWKAALGPASLKNLLLIPLKFSIGRISLEPKKLYYLLSIPWTLFICSVIFRGILKQKILGGLVFLPIFLGLVFSVFTPLLQYFRFIYLLPIISILLALSLGAHRRVISLLVSMLILGVFVCLSCMYLLMYPFHREDWKSAASAVNDKKNVYMIIASSDPLRYYGYTSALIELRTINLKSELPPKITIIPYAADIYGYDYKNILINKGYASETIKTYRGVRVEEWKRKDNPSY